MKMPSAWVYLRYLALPFLVVAGTLIGGWWNMAVPITCFVVHPMLNIFSGDSKKTRATKVSSTQQYRSVALLFVPVLVIVTAFEISNSTTSTVAWLGAVFSSGTMNGILGFTLAHEFIHRRSRLEKMAGHLLLLQNSYLHYAIEHIGGHHVYACTAEDPHTARHGESFYRYLPRAILFTFLNAWKIEGRRIMKKGGVIVSIANHIIRFILLQFLVFAGLYFLAGWPGLLFFILQGGIAIGLLHVTNYLQHYGLGRQHKRENQLEKIGEHHAWRPRKTPDGLNLFQLDKHADHHMHPNRSYEKLVSYNSSPEMPAGYSLMILMAFIPPLWFFVMNKRLGRPSKLTAF
jgi:alkane 1-monooxygenase